MEKQDKYVDKQLENLLVEAEILMKKVDTSKLSLDEINREIYRIQEIGKFVMKDICDNESAQKLAGGISIINETLINAIGNKRLDMNNALGYNHSWSKDIIYDELLTVYGKIEEMYELKQFETKLEQSMGFDNVTKGYMLFGGLSYRQINVYSAFNHHILNFDIKEANHSLFEFIENYRINANKPLSNIEKFITSEMIKSLKYVIKMKEDNI